MKFETEEYTIGSHFLSAIFNEDYTGLTDEEEAQFDEFFEPLYLKGYRHIGLPTNYQEAHFAKCEITGLAGDCVDVIVYFNKEIYDHNN